MINTQTSGRNGAPAALAMDSVDGAELQQVDGGMAMFWWGLGSGLVIGGTVMFLAGHHVGWNQAMRAYDKVVDKVMK